MNVKSYKYILLNNKEWLYEQYITKSLSIRKISKLVGCKTSNSVRQALIRNGIPVRNVSDGLTIHNRPICVNPSVIDGCLLGDAWLFRYSPNSEISMPYFIKKNKFIDHVRYNAYEFYPNHDDIDSFIHLDMRMGIEYYVFRTTIDKKLLSFYNRWYSCGTRQPPDDVIINSESVLNWFMDDGSSYHRRKTSNTTQITITLSCEGFDSDRIDMLVDRLNVYTKLPFRKSKCNSGCGYRITLSQSYSQKFFDYIGECPVESMKYKWKYSE